MESPTEKRVWGRPVAAFQMTDGSLLVTDDGGNKIWRVVYRK
jgi:glucose/arabinose dehydrogenase